MIEVYECFRCGEEIVGSEIEPYPTDDGFLLCLKCYTQYIFNEPPIDDYWEFTSIDPEFGDDKFFDEESNHDRFDEDSFP